LIERDAGDERLELLARSLPPGFEIRLLMLEPGSDLACDATTWRDALVEVECGQVELHFRHGGRVCVQAGDVLWLSGLGVLRMSNPGRSPAALTGLSRTR
jgi:hypothetical protein